MRKQYNILAVLSFVLSLLGMNLVSLVLGIIALVQIKETHEQGKGFAIAGIIISSLSFLAAILVLLSVLGFLSLTFSGIILGNIFS